MVGWKPIVLAVVVGSAAGSLRARAAEPREDCLLLKNGDLYVGRVLEVGEEGLSVEFELDGRRVTTSVLRSQIEPYCLYLVMRERMENPTAEDHRRLGEFALRNGLYFVAKACLEKALEMDPTLEEALAPELRRSRASFSGRVVDDMREHLRLGHTENAGRCLRVLRSDFPEAALDDKLLQQLRGDHTGRGKGPEATPAGAKDLDRLARSKRLLDRAIGYREIALGNKRPSGDAIDILEFAIRLLKKSEGSLSGRGVGGLDAGSIPGPDALRKRIRSELVHTYVTLGTLLANRGSLRDAMDALNKAVLVDPENVEARRLRDRIVETGVRSGYYKNYWRRRGR